MAGKITDTVPYDSNGYIPQNGYIPNSGLAVMRAIGGGTDTKSIPSAVQIVSTGGSATLAVAAGVAGAVAVKTGAGRLARVLVTTLGTAAVNLYDNASAASGTVICAIPASAAAGTFYDVQMPVANGIFVGGATNTPALTVAFD